MSFLFEYDLELTQVVLLLVLVFKPVFMKLVTKKKITNEVSTKKMYIKFGDHFANVPELPFSQLVNIKTPGKYRIEVYETE